MKNPKEPFDGPTPTPVAEEIDSILNAAERAADALARAALGREPNREARDARRGRKRPNLNPYRCNSTRRYVFDELQKRGEIVDRDLARLVHVEDLGQLHRNIKKMGSVVWRPNEFEQRVYRLR